MPSDAGDEEGAVVDAAPFEALRYDPAVAGSPAVASAPAYDLIEPMSYTRHRTANPYTVLELMAPDGAYRRSRQLFERWRRSGVLMREEAAYYRYEQHQIAAAGSGRMLDVQRGVLAAVRLEPLGAGAILPHEEVDPERVAARLRRLEAVPAELDPVYLVLEDPPAELTSLLTSEPSSPPVVAASDEQGIDHRMWALRDPDTQARIRRVLAGSRAMIADGHHRYARSLAYLERARARREPAAGQRSAGQEPPFERVFAYLVDPRAGGPRVEAMHRLLRPVAPARLDRLSEDFATEEAPSDPAALRALLDDTPGLAYGLLRPGGSARLLRARDSASLRARLPAGSSDDYRRLDAAVLLHAVLPRLGLPTSSVAVRADAGAAAAEVAKSPDTALVLLRPPALRDVLALASGGELLPYKSTRFVPKPRTGLLIRPLDEPAMP